MFYCCYIEHIYYVYYFTNSHNTHFIILPLTPTIETHFNYFSLNTLLPQLLFLILKVFHWNFLSTHRNWSRNDTHTEPPK